MAFDRVEIVRGRKKVQILDLYAGIYEDLLAIPVIKV